MYDQLPKEVSDLIERFEKKHESSVQCEGPTCALLCEGTQSRESQYASLTSVLPQTYR